MRTFIATAVMVIAGLMSNHETAMASSAAMSADFVFVPGGSFKNIKSSYYGKGVSVSGFYIGRHEVTQKEWLDVMGSNPSRFKGDDRPVEMVSWYDSIEYCNRRSLKEGLQPYYKIDKTRKDPDNLPDPTLASSTTENGRSSSFQAPMGIDCPPRRSGNMPQVEGR